MALVLFCSLSGRRNVALLPTRVTCCLPKLACTGVVARLIAAKTWLGFLPSTRTGVEFPQYRVWAFKGSRIPDSCFHAANYFHGLCIGKVHLWQQKALNGLMLKATHKTIMECLLQVIPKIALACEFPQVRVVVANALARCLIAFVEMKTLDYHYSLGLKVTAQSHRNVLERLDSWRCWSKMVAEERIRCANGAEEHGHLKIFWDLVGCEIKLNTFKVSLDRVGLWVKRRDVSIRCGHPTFVARNVISRVALHWFNKKWTDSQFNLPHGKHVSSEHACDEEEATCRTSYYITADYNQVYTKW